MTGSERILTALHNGRPDRLPCQVHGWMQYYLDHYLGGADWWQAYERFPGLDWAMYVSPGYTYDERALADWHVEHTDLGVDERGVRHWRQRIVTPGGELFQAGGADEITAWQTEYLVKSVRDFDLWARYRPRPAAVDLGPVRQTYDRLGDRGIIRSHPWSPGQGSPWQSFCILVGTEPAIMWAMDEPGFVHYCLETIVQETIRVTEMWAGTRADMVETGGGAGSNTVISPALFAEFCLPYDQRQHAALEAVGLRIVYHLCGGLMHMLDLVAQNGAHGLETMTPASMGGDCDLAAASARVGEQLFFIGGFDQNAGFEHGTPERARALVRECFEATRDHAGYICCPSDHFFHGDPANLEAFAQACVECRY